MTKCFEPGKDCKTARLQDCKTARPQDCKTARPQDRKTARLKLGNIAGIAATEESVPAESNNLINRIPDETWYYYESIK